MERIGKFVIDMVRHKETGKLLALCEPLSHFSALYVVDEERRQIVLRDSSYSIWDEPELVFVKRKADLAKVREGKEKRLLIAELNRKIVWSNIATVGAVLEKIDEVAYDHVPIDRSGLDTRVDVSALEAASPAVKALAKIIEQGKVVRELLANAEAADAKGLKRYALREPYLHEQQAGERP